MKNLMKWMMSIAVAAISLTGCENNFEEPTKVSNKFELTVTTDNLSRTEYDATLKDIKWSTGDQAQVFVNGSAQALAATIDVTDSRIASFTYSSTLGEGAALIQGFAPANAGEAELGTNEALRFALTLPTTQRATTATFDKSADILVADNLLVNITAEDVAAGKKSVGNFNFHRVVAVSEFTYEVTNSTLAASDEKVESVSFEVISTNNDKFLAGKMYVQPNDEGAKYVDANLAEITDNKDYFYAEDANKVMVILADQPSLKDGFKAWLVTAPITLAADDKLVFTVTTTAGTTITKTIAAVGKELSFSTKQLNTRSSPSAIVSRLMQWSICTASSKMWATTMFLSEISTLADVLSKLTLRTLRPTAQATHTTRLPMASGPRPTTTPHTEPSKTKIGTTSRCSREAPYRA